jgi:hypothetical protein
MRVFAYTYTHIYTRMQAKLLRDLFILYFKYTLKYWNEQSTENKLEKSLFVYFLLFY